MTIHVWVPDYALVGGGIQTFSRFMQRALRDLFPQARICVFSKNDISVPARDDDVSDAFTAFGWWKIPLRTVAFSAGIIGRALQDRPDLIISTHVNFSPAARSLQKFGSFPYLVVGHGVDIWEAPNASVRRALREAPALVAVSEFTKEKMATAVGAPVGAIQVLPNTFDPEVFVPGPKPRFLLKRYGLYSEQPVILTIARLASADRYKGYDEILRALPSVRQRFPDLRYVLGGKGPDEDRIEELINELGVAENVILAGYVPDHELREHYNLCDVFAMPSKGEGFGIVFIEAIACGKPVVAGNKDGSVDAVLNGKIGALVDPEDVGELSATLIQILEGRHPNSVLRDPAELRRKVIEAYGYQKFKQRLGGIVAPFLKTTDGR